MNLLGAKLYDPAGAVSKATTALLAMTAFDTTNLRVTVTVPAHGMLLFRLRCVHHGSTTNGQHLLGVLNGATVVGRVAVTENLLGTAVATTQVKLTAEFVAVGLTPGSTSFDAAYGVEIVASASGAIKYGGPNNTTTNDAFGAFQFEVWDPAPLQVSSQPLQIDSNGRIDIGEVLGTAIATPATAGILDVNVKNIDNDAASASGTVTFPNATLASTTNITAGTITTASNLTINNDKTGYGLSAAAVQAIWDALTSALTTVGSIGKKLADWTIGTAQTGDSFARLGAPAGASVSADIAAAKADTAAIKTKTDQMVFTVANQLDANALTGGGGLDAAATRAALGLASANLDTQLSGIDSKTTNLPSDPADESLVIAATDAIMARIGAAGANLTALGDTRIANLDAAVSSRSTLGGTAQTGDSFARIGAAGAGLTALGDARLANLDATVSSRNATAPDNAGIAAIQAKTDNLPAAPAATGDCLTEAGVRSAVGMASDDLDEQLDAISTQTKVR